jgi:hypothetical protein
VKSLLTASALIEAATGLALVAFPSLASTLLLGSSLDTPVALTVARAAGVALLALGVACWCGRIAEPGPAVRGVLRAMALYNVGIVALRSGAFERPPSGSRTQRGHRDQSEAFDQGPRTPPRRVGVVPRTPV